MLELSVDDVGAEGGVKKIIDRLDRLFRKVQNAYIAYETFESFKRSSEMSITEYINEFERLHHKIKEYDMGLPSDVLAYRLLKQAGLSESYEQVARATVSELTFEKKKLQLKKIFGDITKLPLLESVRVGPIMQVTHTQRYNAPEEIHYGQSYSNWRPHRGKSNFRGQQNDIPSYRGSKHNQAQYRGNTIHDSSTRRRTNQSFKPTNGRQLNPLGSDGYISRCMICQSVCHWANQCPHAYENQQKYGEVSITMYKTDFTKYKEEMSVLVGETWSMAVIDSGASSTVCGLNWYNCYVDSLTEENKRRIKMERSDTLFKFGDGEKIKSLRKVYIPIKIGEKDVMLQTDVVNTEIPLFLSKQAMKRGNAVIDFDSDVIVITMFGVEYLTTLTTSGHYAIPISIESNLMSKLESESTVSNVTLIASGEEDKHKIAVKLHRQFAHPKPDTLITLLRNAGSDDDELFNVIKEL